MTKETWKPVPGYEGFYEVSDQGRVRSLTILFHIHAQNKLPRTREKVGRVLRQSKNTHGYPQVTLNKQGKGQVKCVHILVMSAFVGPRPIGSDIRHLDGNRLNNCLSNLAYGTRAENMRDMVRHNMSSLSQETVHEIRRELKSGKSHAEIARQYGVGRCVVTNINTGRTYSYV